MMSLQKTVKLIGATLLFCGVAALYAIPASAQSSVQEQVAQLREQLETVKSQEADQQSRLLELDEALKPENIEKSLAGVGSTRPEELRAQRRKQLEKERLGVQNQLTQLALSRTRLEKAVATAEARAYQESARGPETAAHGPQVSATQSTATTNTTRPRKATRKRKPVRHVKQ